MKEWFSARALCGLAGMPKRSQEVHRFMRRRGATPRAAQGQGGGWLWPINALPPATRAALAARMASEAARAGRHEARKVALADAITGEALHNRRVTGLKTSLQQPATGQRRIDAKLKLLAACEQFQRAAGIPVAAARHQFAVRYNRGEIEAEAWVRELIPALSAASLQRWSMTIKREGVARLAGAYGNRKGASVIERQPELYEFTVGMLVQYPHCSSSHLMQAMRARFNGHNTLDYPSPRALQRWVTRWKSENKQVFTAIANPDAWKGRFMVAHGLQSEDITRLNQLWEMDSTPGDVMLTDGRHTLIGVIDVYARRGKLLVTKTSKATAIATLMRHALLDWGVPEAIKKDNGQDYTSHHIERVLASLEIDPIQCPPFQPWRKPHIERFFGTFTRDLVELLPGFIGHDVAERQAIEARASFADRLLKRGGVLEVKLASAEFQAICDRWCEDLYAHRPHAGLKDKSPFEVVAGCREPVRRITDERALDILLAEAPDNNGQRVVQKKGILLERAWFIAPELGAHVGDVVHVRYDPSDLGRIYVFDAEGAFICVAEAPERTGMDRQEVAAHAREKQKAQVQEERRRLKASARKLNLDDIVREILEERASAAGRLARLPAPATPHETAGLAAAARAARAHRTPEPAPLTAEERAAMAVLEREIAEGAPRRVVALETPEFNYKRWLALDVRLATGENLTEDELAWHRSYRGSDEWRAMERMAEDFPQFKQLEK